MAENNEMDKITTNVGERDFVVERMFNAPRELVFEAYTVPEHVARWWAPIPYTIPVCKIDLRPGGIWHYCMRSPEGEEQWVKMIYREIVRPERIVYISTFSDKDANTVDVIPEQYCTATFTEYEGKTKLSIRVQFGTAEERKKTMDMGMIEGMTMTLNELDNLLQKIKG